MFARRFAVAVGVAALCSFAWQPTPSAQGTFRRTMYLSFSKTVALPGVTLPAGTYTFELTDPIDAPDVVRVMNRSHDKLYFQGFTQRVARPATLRVGQLIAFGEARPDEPLPIHVWYPADESTGREFLYPSR